MMKKQKSTPTGKTEKFNDATIAEYTDGSWRYTGDNGRTKGSLARRPAWLTSLTTETALAANEIKKDKRREAFRNGVVPGAKALSDRPINNSAEAFEFLVEKRMESALSCESGTMADVKWIDEGLHGGQKKDKDVPKIVIHVDGDFVQAAQLVRERHAIEDTVIEGEYVDQG